MGVVTHDVDTAYVNKLKRIKAELKWCAPVMPLYRPVDLSREVDTNVDNGALFKGAEASSFD